ncbi:uncharacterized protein N7500_008543 [Penicillium coprophilum]|uniref:uncharacterized protein n=1 Tax=Penicillium coprophilum TaxID=36646 RepID=UPI00239AAC31|nr:uncharacterized protein N7500_008543 [Penicillium coprophilum]KAJ5158892.1 hypothetical protein N7500_008543 [Penicillium coprophilum]
MVMANIHFSRHERILLEVKELSFSVKYNDYSRGEYIRVSNLTRIHYINIHDILKSYYKVTRKRFINNIYIQAADYYLVTRPTAPIKFFSPLWVYNLSRGQLDQIAREEAAIRRKRRQLQK